MRIISGMWGSRLLVTPEGLDTRPTLDRVKEGLFSSLSPYIPGATVLDLFAGSGALGLECLSRGAASAVLVDASREAISAITKNVKDLKAENAVIVAKNAISYIASAEGKFQLVFLDPPYESGLAAKCATLLLEKGLLSADCRLVAEWDERCPFTVPDGFAFIKERRYGKTYLTFFTPAERNDQA